MAPHSSTLAWKTPWMEEPGGLHSMGSWRVGHDWVTSLSRIGEGNGNPLQCSCLENPRDWGAWWAAIYGVAQSWTQLKWLSSSTLFHIESIPLQSQKYNMPLTCQIVSRDVDLKSFILFIINWGWCWLDAYNLPA